jgi:hypothetical protein
MRIGVLELLSADARPDGWGGAYRHWIARQYASIMPQAVSVWCRQLGHDTFYATYYGQAEPLQLLPDDLDVVFIATYTSASPLAYALAKLYRRGGAVTVIGGPHAKAFPDDCLRFFDVAVGECDRSLVAEIVRERPRRTALTSGRPLADLPSVQERLPEIRTAAWGSGRPGPYAVIGLLASVGCPYRCDFCTDWNNPYALLPLDRLEADLAFVSAELPRVKVAFHDPNFAVRFDPVMEAMQRVAPPARVPYLMESSLSILRQARLERLRETRCWYAAAGIESWAGYSDKSGAGATAAGARKLEHVLERFAALAEAVPLVQANFIFGTDEDHGDDPVELTAAFVHRAAQVWPNLTVPTPFGGTPLYERHRREGRIVEAMPFAFYNSPYLVTTPRHYDPGEYYDKLARVLAELTSPRALRARLRPARKTRALIDGLRLLGIRRTLAEVRAIAALLGTDRAFRAFHERRSAALPEFYARRFSDRLGRYRDLLDERERTPLLPAASAEPQVFAA